MAAFLRKELKKEVFHPNGDRLFAVVEVITGEQEDERYYLCSSVTNGNEVQITFVKNMISSENEQFEKITTWYLEDLKLVDGKEANQDNPHFDMHFDKVYGWESSSTASKYTFVRCLQELNHDYLGKKITFVNFDADFLTDTSSIIPQDEFEQHFKDTELKPTDIQLRTHTGEKITPVGMNFNSEIQQPTRLLSESTPTSTTERRRSQNLRLLHSHSSRQPSKVIPPCQERHYSTGIRNLPQCLNL